MAAVKRHPVRTAAKKVMVVSPHQHDENPRPDGTGESPSEAAPQQQRLEAIEPDDDPDFAEEHTPSETDPPNAVGNDRETENPTEV